MDSTQQLLQTVLEQLNSQRSAPDSSTPTEPSFSSIASPSESKSNRTSTDTVVISNSSEKPDNFQDSIDPDSNTNHEGFSHTQNSSSNSSPSIVLPPNSRSSNTQSIGGTSDSNSVAQSESQSFPEGAAIQLNERGLTFLPVELVQAMTASVSKLSLQANKLTTLPSQIRFMENLTYLDISHNNFVEFPPVLTECPSLIILDISFNQIKRLPENVGHLDSLNILSMSHNKFKYMPPAIVDMVDLMVVQIDGNPWVYPPKEITNHPGSQSDDQTEWLELLRSYMDENLTVIQQAIQADTDDQPALSNAFPSSSMLNALPTSRSNSIARESSSSSDATFSAPQTPLEFPHLDPSIARSNAPAVTLRSALTTPSTTAMSSPNIMPSNYPHISTTTSFSALPSLTQNGSASLNISPVRKESISSTTPSTLLGSHTVPDGHSITDIDSLRNILKTNGTIPDNSNIQMNRAARSGSMNSDTVSELPEKSKSNAENAPTYSSRAAKRMGFVVKQPARAESVDGIPSQRSTSSNARAGIGGAGPGGNNVGVPMSASVSASAVALSSHNAELSQSSSTTSLASIHLDNLKLAPPPLLSPEEHSGSYGSVGSIDSLISNPSGLSTTKNNNLVHSSSNISSQQSSNSIHPSRSHSRQLSRDNDSSDTGTIGSFSTPNLNTPENGSGVNLQKAHTHSSRSSVDDSTQSRFNTNPGSHHLATSHSNNNHPTIMSGNSSSTTNFSHMSSQKSKAVNANLIRERSHSLSVTSSPEKDSSTEHFRWLSTVNEEIKPLMNPADIRTLSKEMKEFLNVERKIIVAARDILFSLVEFHSIIRRCTRLCTDKTLTAEMHTILYSGQSLNDKLVKMLEKEELRFNTTVQNSAKKDPAEELKLAKASIKTVASACVASIRTFKQMTQFCNENLFRFTSAVDVKFIRCIILVTFGSFNELYNSWNVLNEIDSPTGYHNGAAHNVGNNSNSSRDINNTLPSSYIAAGLDNLPMPHSHIGKALHQDGSPTTPSVLSPGNTYAQRGVASTNASPVSAPNGTLYESNAPSSGPVNFALYSEIDEQLYRGLEAAATAAKVLLKQLTETLTKTGREMREAQAASRQQGGPPAISVNVKNHVKNLSEKCQAGVTVTKNLKYQLEVIRNSRMALLDATSNGSGGNNNNGASSAHNNGYLQLEMSDRLKIWEDMNSFVIGIISLLTSTKSAMNDMPYLKNASNLATLTKLTKDIPPLMEKSSYKAIISSESKDHDHVGGISSSSNSASQQGQNSMQSGNPKGHPTQISLPSYTNLTSVIVGPSTVSGSNQAMQPFAMHPNGPATTTAIPSSNPFEHSQNMSGTQTTNISYYPNNYNNSQFSAPPSTPLAAVLGTTAAALVLPSPPVNKTYSHSPFFPQMDATHSSSASQLPSSSSNLSNTMNALSAASMGSFSTSETAKQLSSSSSTAQPTPAGQSGLLSINTHSTGQHAPSLPSPLASSLNNNHSNNSSSGSESGTGRYHLQGMHSRNHSNGNNGNMFNALHVNGGGHSPNHFSSLHAALSSNVNSHKGSVTAPHSVAQSTTHSRTHSDNSNYEGVGGGASYQPHQLSNSTSSNNSSNNIPSTSSSSSSSYGTQKKTITGVINDIHIGNPPPVISSNLSNGSVTSGNNLSSVSEADVLEK